MDPIKVTLYYGANAHLASLWGVATILLSLFPMLLLSGALAAVLTFDAWVIGIALLCFDWLWVPRRAEVGDTIQFFSCMGKSRQLKWSEISNWCHYVAEGGRRSALRYFSPRIRLHVFRLKLRCGGKIYMHVDAKDACKLSRMIDHMVRTHRATSKASLLR